MITGYRRFNIEKNRELGTYYLKGSHSTGWEGRELQAECAGYKELALLHLTEDRCTYGNPGCGIYVLKQPDLDPSYKTWPVLAAVSGWGAYVEYHSGWRVQFSRIEHLWLEDPRYNQPDIIEALTKRYESVVEIRLRPDPREEARKSRLAQVNGIVVQGNTVHAGGSFGITLTPVQPQCVACGRQHEMAYWPSNNGSISICKMETSHIVNAMRYLNKKHRSGSEMKWEFLFEQELKRRAPQKVNGKMKVGF